MECLMTVSSVSGPLRMTHRELLDKTQRACAPELELDRDVFVRVYDSQYKEHFARFCRTGQLPLGVIAYCQKRLREKSSA